MMQEVPASFLCPSISTTFFNKYVNYTPLSLAQCTFAHTPNGCCERQDSGKINSSQESGTIIQLYAIHSQTFHYHWYNFPHLPLKDIDYTNSIYVYVRYTGLLHKLHYS
jgi:hypothetical protein